MKNITDLPIPYTNNVGLKLRYMSIQKRHEGQSKASIAKTLNVSRSLADDWIAKYLSNGFDGLSLKVATERPPLLTDRQKTQLKE